MAAPDDIFYSTQPKRATGLDGYSYFIKGWSDRNIVVAEAVAHQLARHLDLNVPEFGIAIPSDKIGPLFASREIARCQRQIEMWLRQDRTVNRTLLSEILAFDIWIMNKDRNIGNVVGEEQLAPHRGRVALVAIDFEKAMALRGPYPLTTTPNIVPKSLWPSGTLGKLVAGDVCPKRILTAIESVTDQQVLDCFNRVEAALNESISWKDSSVLLLNNRAKRIRTLVAEVWHER